MTYRNPVIPGFFPDPSVCRVGDEFFLVTSSFIYSPGVPIFRSSNLVDWTQIGNVLDRPSQLDLSATKDWASLGIYAPTLRHHDGQFFMITTNVGSTGATTFLVTSKDPAGPWSDPIPVPVPGIDPDLAWDDEENCWVHFSGLGGIARCRIDSGTGSFVDGPERTWSGTGLQFPEAPHLYEREGIWYLLIAEGGTQGGHCVSVAAWALSGRALGSGAGQPDPHAPQHGLADSEHRPRRSGRVHRRVLVDGPARRPPEGHRARFHTLGRETFLVPVRWEDGWPVPGDPAPEMATAPGPSVPVEPAGREDFELSVLGHHWVGVRRPPDAVSSLTERPGWLVLRGGEEGLDTPEPTFVGRRQQHHYCRSSTRVEAVPAAEAGLSVLMDHTAHYDVAVTGDRVVGAGPCRITREHGGQRAPSGRPRHPDRRDGARRHGPDSVSLGFEDGAGTAHTLARLDGRYVSTEVTGGFLGRLIGMYAVGGEAAFDWFEYAEA